MFNQIKGDVVVITGASGGIGRATAKAFAKKKARLVLAARRDTALQMVADQCEDLGGSARVVPTDVTDPRSVDALARRAVAEFGKIDVWVNNAAVTLFSRHEEAPPEAFRRVVETNLMGYAYGARAAVAQFREQGSGTLINVSSSLARRGAPYLSAYVSSKAGVDAMSTCLRQELRDTNIEVCLVLPASIDTPLFQQSANYTGMAVKPVDPVYHPQRVSKAIVKLAKRPKNITFVGPAGRLLGVANKLFSSATDEFIANRIEEDHFQSRPTPPSEGNLFEPNEAWARTTGGWNGKKRRVAAAMAKVAKVGAVLAVPAATYLLWTNRERIANGAVKGLLPR